MQFLPMSVFSLVLYAVVLCSVQLEKVTARLVDVPPQIFTSSTHGHEKSSSSNNLADLNFDRDVEEEREMRIDSGISSNPLPDFMISTNDAECTVEVVNKIPGRCEKLGPMGRACIAGSYMNLFSDECL